MEFFSKQFAQIRLHLGGMTGSQKLVLACALVGIVAGFVSLFSWSGRPEMVPLLDQPMKQTELTRIENELSARGQTYRTTGEQILVPASDRTRLQGVIAQTGLMPADTSIGFAKLIEEANVWIPREESRWQRKIALGNELAKVISNFDGVAEAKVFLDSPERRGFGEAPSAPTASVFLRTRAGVVLEKARVAALASLVSGAVNGLRPDAVRIVDATTGKPYRVPNEEDALPYDMMDLRRQKEDHFGRKILAQLSYIPGVLVGVHVDLDTERRHEHREKYGPPVPSEEETRTSESSTRGSAASPGVRANTRSATVDSGPSESTTTEESRTSLLGERDRTVTDTDSAPGVIRTVRASINIPRSYFVSIFRQLNGGQDPSEKDLEPIISGEERKVRGQVRQLIAAASDSQVEVSWFYDTIAAAPSETAPDSKAIGLAGVLQEHGKPAALGLLALVSVLLVLQMGRRAVVGPPSRGGAAAEMSVTGGSGRSGGSSSGRDGDNGRAGGHQPRAVELPAPEFDEAVAVVQAMVSEIKNLVGNEPEVAASILDRWMSQSK